MPTLRTITLGCKVNQYETEYLREGLARLGYRDAVGDEPADLCVVNTCTVTATADAKSRKAIRQLARENPGTRIIVVGCLAASAADEVAALPGVVEVLGDKRQLPDLLGRLGLADVPTGIARFGRRHRAYVKVQDGCRMHCSYCIIPTVRPYLASRPADDVLAEIRRLIDGGYREIVLTGIHLGHYGAEPESRAAGIDLAGLVRRVVALDGEFRVRISSLEAAEVSEELIALVAERPERICPHLHLSMQSGSDAVLRRMRRRWSAGQFVEHCQRIAAALDEPAMTTDVIVGFPGETDDDFSATCRAVEAVGFSKVHVFRYSPRRGTPAAEMPDQLPESVKQRRAAELGDLAERLRRQYFERLTGRELQVLVERPARGGRADSDQEIGALRTCPTSPLKKGATAGLPSSAVGIPRGNTAGQASSGTHELGIRHNQRAATGLWGTSDRYAPVELVGGRELIGRLVTITAGPVVAGRIRAARVWL